MSKLLSPKQEDVGSNPTGLATLAELEDAWNHHFFNECHRNQRWNWVCEVCESFRYKTAVMENEERQKAIGRRFGHDC